MKSLSSSQTRLGVSHLLLGGAVLGDWTVRDAFWTLRTPFNVCQQTDHTGCKIVNACCSTILRCTLELNINVVNICLLFVLVDVDALLNYFLANKQPFKFHVYS